MRLRSPFTTKPKNAPVVPKPIAVSTTHYKYHAPQSLAAGHGASPSGTMSVTLDRSLRLAGHTMSDGTLIITYNMPAGLHRGVTFDGTERVAYLPDSNEGRFLLDRLCYAFSRGHIFSIGTSQTSGQSNVIVWGSIPHKTSLVGGEFGYPDPAYVTNCHLSLQALGVPDGASSNVLLPLQSAILPPPLLPPVDEAIKYKAPDSLSDWLSIRAVLEAAPVETSGECAICLESLSHASNWQLVDCKHVFHKKCIEGCLQHSTKCPVCRVSVGIMVGKSPSGSMKVKSISQNCPGFGGCQTIQIDYKMPGGIQHCYHEHPGQSYSGTNRTAYLPYNTEGMALLRRLKYAFAHGLIFHVGTSVTTGQKNATVWSSIHHKTTLRGGSYSFPDNQYMNNCHTSLDALGVPAVDSL